MVLRKNPQSSDQINDVVNDLHFSKYKNTLKVWSSKLINDHLSVFKVS